MIRLVLADDQDLVREGLRMMLEAEPDLEVVGEAATGAGAVARTAQHRPDVVLMDIQMPDLDGIEATRRIVASGSPVRVLILTTFDLDEYVYRALRAGAAGFLLKDASRVALASAVRTVAAGDTLLAPTITRKLIADYCRRPPQDPSQTAPTKTLSPRELDVLRLVAAGLSNAEIASEMFLSAATVKSHVARLLAKLGLRDRVQLVVLAYESGFVQPGG